MDSMRVLDLPGLQGLIDILGARGYAVVGPTVHDDAIVSSTLTSVDDLPRGWGDEQHDDHVGLRRRGDDALFGYTEGAHAPTVVRTAGEELGWRARRSGTVVPLADPRTHGVNDWVAMRAAGPVALFGARPCDLAGPSRALVPTGTDHGDAREANEHNHAPVDPSARDAARDAATFVVAVTCSDPRETCVCALTGVGPHPAGGYDLALTELLDDGPHRFLVQVGSTRGAGVLAEVATRVAAAADVQAAEDVASRSAAQMGRQLDSTGLKDALKVSAKTTRWDDVSSRCLACTLAVVRIARRQTRTAQAGL
jgi:hypothetical protein